MIKIFQVFRSSNVTKMICNSKTVKCLAVAQSKVYLGCSDSSIQVVRQLQKKLIGRPLLETISDFHLFSGVRCSG